MADINLLHSLVNERFAAWIKQTQVALGELTVEVKPEYIHDICVALRDDPDFDFKLLIDVCGVDYLQYGLDEWQTETTTETGFGRGVTRFHPVAHLNDLPDANEKIQEQTSTTETLYRFAVVYHLLSISKNHRIRLRVNLPTNAELMVDSVMDIWPAADWFEREAFDLFGMLFRGHPDLRRLLTDYGFAGHPFRKDFPLIGKVEARYDATLKRVIYEPVSIQPRVLEPKVIRDDNRYLSSETENTHGK